MNDARAKKLLISVLLVLLCSLVPCVAAAQTAYISAKLPDDICPPPATSCYRGAILAVDSTTGVVQSSIDLWRSASSASTAHDVVQLQVNAAGTRLYAAVQFSATDPGGTVNVAQITSYDVATLARVNEIQFSGVATGMTVAADGTRVFVPRLFTFSDVVVLDGSLGLITTFFSSFPSDIAISTTGQRLYVAAGSAVNVHNGATLTQIATVNVASPVTQLVLSTSGTHLYAVMANGAIADINTVTNVVTATITNFGTGGTIAQQAASANHRLWVTVRSSTNTESDEKITVFNEATRAIVDEYSLPRPFAIAASGNQKRVMVTSPGSVWGTIDAITGDVIVSAPGIGTEDAGDNLVAFGPAPATSQVIIDAPAPNAIVSQPFEFSGWAVDVFGFGDGPGIDQITVTATPHAGGPPIALGDAEYSRARPDVAAIFGPGYANAGFLMSVSGLPSGTFTLTASAHSPRTGGTVAQKSVVITVGLTSPTSTLTRNPAVLNFGAARNGSGVLTSVTAPQSVTVGVTGAPASWTATSNQPWAVVTNGAGTGAGQFIVSIDNSGDSIGNATSLSATITVAAATANPVTVAVHLDVQPSSGGSAAPFGQIDLPIQNVTGVVGAVGVTGWALDDIGVTGIKVYRNCVAFDPAAACVNVGGNNVVFVGDAKFLAGARPDVEAAFPTLPNSYAAGWGMQILTNMFPDVPAGQAAGGQGTFQIFVFASDADGHLTLLGRTSETHAPTTVTLDNNNIAKPFGTLDTPQLGETVSGTIANFGWALTPDLNTVADGTDILIPLNGSTVTVFIDSQATAPILYNQCRGTVGTPPAGFCNDDVANAFGNVTPQPPLTPRGSNPTRYRNLDTGRGAIGVYVIDTTTLANGLHTIEWSVQDSAGRIEGIGSRFFTVLNGGSGLAGGDSLDELLARPAVDRGAAATLDDLTHSTRSVEVRTGFDRKAPARTVEPAADGVATVSIPASGRIEIALAAPADAGYLVIDGSLRDLPVGAGFDAKRGVFAWAPPPGMFGTYRIALVAGGEKVVVDVVVGRQ